MRYPFVDERIRAHVKAEFYDPIDELCVTDATKALIKAEVDRELVQSTISPGENVGLLVATSLCERLTQSTLSSFHQSGMFSATVTTGVPRVGELLNVSKVAKKPVVYGYLAHSPPATVDGIRETRKMLGDSIVETQLHHVIEYYHTEAPNFDKYVHLDRDKQYVTLVLDCQQLVERQLTYTKVLATAREGAEGLLADPAKEISPSLSADALVFIECAHLDTFEKDLLQTLNGTFVSGMKGVESFSLEPQGGQLLVHIHGDVFEALMGSDRFHYPTLLSTNVWNFYSHLGVEAAREYLIREFKKAIGVDDTAIGNHIALLVDSMTQNGNILPVSRYGMRVAYGGKGNSDSSSTYSKASFEESLENLLKSGVFADQDNMTSLSASTISGKMNNSGTGLCELKLDSSVRPRHHAPPPTLSGSIAFLGDARNWLPGFF